MNMNPLPDDEQIERQKRLRKISAVALLYAVTVWMIAGIYTQIARRTSPDVQLPLANVGQITVDGIGSIYCDLRSFRRIQVYDQNGKFNKAVPYDGILIRLDFADETGLAVTTMKNQRVYFHFLQDNGNLVQAGSAVPHEMHYDDSPIRQHVSSDGRKYVIRGHSAGRIVRTDATGRYTLATAPFCFVLCEPRLVWVVGLLGVAGLIYASKRLYDMRVPEPDDPDSLDSSSMRNDS